MDKPTAQLYIDALLEHYPGKSLQEIRELQRESRKAARSQQLEVELAERVRMRQQFDAEADRRDRVRDRLLRQCRHPNPGLAFRFLARHLGGQPSFADRVRDFVVVGRAAEVFHQTRELPKQPLYLVFAYPEDAGRLCRHDPVGNGDHVFDRHLVGNGVVFNVEVTLHPDWVQNPEFFVAQWRAGKPLRIPVLNRELLARRKVREAIDRMTRWLEQYGYREAEVVA